MRIRMKNTLNELETWNQQNPGLPEVVKNAICHYKAELRSAIEDLSKHPFVVGQEVELNVSMETPRTGTVMQIRTEHLPPDGHIQHSALISWDDKTDEHRWIASDELSHVQENY